jgi:hypothetical protein
MPNVSIAVTGNMEESVNTLMKGLLSSTEKSNLSYSAAIKFADTLEEITKESQDTIKDCMNIQDKQIAVNRESDINTFTSKFKDCGQQFVALHAFVAAGVKKNKSVPPITDDIKKSLPPEIIKRLETARSSTEKFRELAKTAFRQTKKNHDEILGYINGLRQKIIEEKSVVNSVPPSSNPSFSLYGASQQASQQRAQEAKQQSGQNAQANNINRQENK